MQDVLYLCLIAKRLMPDSWFRKNGNEETEYIFISLAQVDIQVDFIRFSLK